MSQAAVVILIGGARAGGLSQLSSFEGHPIGALGYHDINYAQLRDHEMSPADPPSSLQQQAASLQLMSELLETFDEAS